MGSSSGKPRDLPWIFPSILLPWFMASPVAPAHPSIGGLHFAQITYSCIGGQIRTNTSARSLGALGVSESQDPTLGRTQYLNQGRIPSLAVVFCFVPILMFFVDPKTCGRKTFKCALLQSQSSHHL